MQLITQQLNLYSKRYQHIIISNEINKTIFNISLSNPDGGKSYRSIT